MGLGQFLREQAGIKFRQINKPAGRWVQHRQIKFDPASTEHCENWEQALLSLLK